MDMEVRFKKSSLFVVLLKELFRETTLLGCKVQNFLVVELAIKLFCKGFCYAASATSELSPNVDQFLFHLSFLNRRRKTSIIVTATTTAIKSLVGIDAQTPSIP